MALPVHSLPSLGYGQFFGTARERVQVSGFSLVRMVPELPPEQVPPHSHEEASFVLILRGTYISSAREAGHVCGPRTLIYNPPGITHRDRFTCLDGEFLAISVSPHTLGHVQEQVRVPECATAFRRDEAVSVAQRVLREWGRWDAASPLVAEGLCLELLALIARQRGVSLRRPPAWLHRARELLHEQCSDGLRVAEAARILGVHPVHFVRAFRQFFRSTPGEYMRHCRLEKAASLLASTELPLAQVALAAGFADQSHFTKVFRRGWGRSPGAYRQLQRRPRAHDGPTC